MAELTTKKRDNLKPSQFAYVDKDGKGHLPINDAAHVRNALARFDQTDFPSAAVEAEARRKVAAAARRFGVAVDGAAEHAHMNSLIRRAGQR